jgi:3-hydroxyisobutyrate dehydrogenase
VTKAVTVLGTGLMGTGMAHSLLRAGFEVTVWNRTVDKARPLEADGATVAEDVTSAVSGADVVITMLFDADAVIEVMEQALPAMRGDAVWLQTSTVGLDATDNLAELAARHRIELVDAPMLGTRQPAEEGKLIVLAGGPSRLRDALDPVLEAIGSRIVWVGEKPGDGHRLKLAANSWVLSVTGATAQSIGLAADLGVSPQQFLEVISGGPLDCPYAQLKGKAMIDRDFSPSFTLGGATKDAGLILAAMHAVGTDDRLMSALREQFTAAADQGHAAEDMASVVTAVSSTAREV